MIKDFTKPSLLSFLQSGVNNFKLEISLTPMTYQTLQAPLNPFFEISEAGPFARLLEGHILTDAGSVIKRVFLLQQSDDYYLPGDTMWPITNSDLDRIWQEAFSTYSKQTQESLLENAPFVLTEQINENGEIIPFQPLFYCIHKKIYFHPICPKCGNYLHLCKDDDLLDSLNLNAYSTSLKRHLYCPECAHTSDQMVCYSINRDATDPAIVKDQFSLANEIGNLIANSGPLNHYPCPDCPELIECYGNENLAGTRIVPYSFYPFHLLIFDAATLNATDFIAYLSGATLDELTDHLIGKKVPGRINCVKAFQQKAGSLSPYLFTHDSDKNFLEVLFLKLSFLGELMQLILSEHHSLSWPDFSFSLDRVWVKLADQAGRLPVLWNFNLEILDIGFHVAGTPHLSKYPPVYGLHFLGNVWFYVMLVNNQHPVERVHADLDQFLAQAAAGEKILQKFDPQNGSDSILSPANIYWNPQEKRVNQNWLEMWKKALDLGESLLVAGMNRETQWSADLFWQNFEILREEIKSELFGTSPSAFREKSYANDHVISAILTRIMEKWRSELKETPGESLTEISPPPVVQDEPRDMEIAETVILSPDDAAKIRKSPMQPAGEEETLILQPKAVESGNAAVGDLQGEDIIQETIILSPGASENKLLRPEPPALNTGEDDMPETIIISPSQQGQGHFKSNQQPKTTERSSGGPNISGLEGDPFKEEKTARLKKKDAPEDDDDLAETVIIPSDIKKDNTTTNE